MPATTAHIENLGPETVTSTSPKRTKNSFVHKLLLRFKAKRQARKILNAIGQADQIHKGRKPGRSYDEFLQDL